MNASRITSPQRKIIVGIFAAIVAGLTLLFAWPNFQNQIQFKTAAVVAGALDETTTTSPIPLSDVIILEPGAVIQSQFKTAADGKQQNNHQRSQPYLNLKNATLTVLQAPATQTQSAASGRKIVTTTPLINALRDLGFGALRLDNTAVQLKRPGGSLQHIGRVTGVVHANVGQKELTAEGKFEREGTSLSFTAQSNSDQTDPATKALQVTITGDDLQLTLNGKLTTKGSVRVTSENATFATADLKKVLRWLGMGPLKSNGFSKFSATGLLSWSGSTVAFDQSQISVDGNQASGRLSFYFDPREPSIEGTLAFQKLELTPYIGATDQPTAISAMTNAWTAIHDTVSDGSLPLGLKDIDADIRVSAKSLQYGATEIGQGAAVILVKDGKLKADIADMTLSSGARGRSQIEIDTTTYMPRYTLHGSVNGFDLGTASTQWFGKSIVDGVANMTFDLTAHGRSKNILISTLSGPIVIDAEKGASIPINLLELFTTAKKSPNDGWEHIEKGFTALKDLSVEVISSKGSLKTKSVKANISGNPFIATGSLKLSDLVLDLILTKIVASDGSKPSSTKTQAQTDSDTLEFKGPITEPIIRFVRQSRKG